MNLARANVVLAVLAAVLAVPTALHIHRDAASFGDHGTPPLLFDGFTADTVAVITLAQPKKDQPVSEQQPPQQQRVAYDQLQFQRTDKGFVLASGDLVGAPVSKERVESDVFAHLRAIRADRDSLVQANATPEQLAQYGLDEAQAFVVRVTDANVPPNVIAELLVGRDAGQGQAGTDAVRGVFVRKSDASDVVLYEFEKGWRRDVQQDLWLDKVLARVEPEKVRKLSIRNAATAGATWRFERGGGKASWQVVEPPRPVGAVRQTEVENLLQRLRWISVQDYRAPLQRAGNLAALGLAPPQLELELLIHEGDRERSLRLAVGNQLDGKNEYYLTTNESAFLMTWPAGFVAPLELDVPAMLFDPLPPDERAGEGPGGDGR